MGLTEGQFKQMEGEGFNVMATSLFKATRDKDGNVPDYRRIQAASPQPDIDSIATYAKLFSGATGVPLYFLGIVQDNPASAEAIAAQREDICVAAEDCIETEPREHAERRAHGHGRRGEQDDGPAHRQAADRHARFQEPHAGLPSPPLPTPT